MTAYITSSQRRHLRQLSGDSSEDQKTMLLNTVQSYIKQNQDSYLNDDLLHVAYTGPRELEVAPVESGTEQVEMNPNHGSLPGVIAAVALVAVFAVVAVGVAIRRRRRKSRTQAEERSGHLHDLDQQGAFPSGLTPESHSHHLSCSDAGDTQGALPPPEYSPQPDNGNLFGLSGARSDEDEEDDVEEGGKPPSSLAVMGTATSLVRELSYSPVNGDDQDQEEEDSNTFDMAPVMSQEDDEHSVDIEPMSPTPNHNDVVDDESIGSADNSSVIYLDEKENALPGQQSPSETTVEARNTTSEMLDDAQPTISDETSEDDEDGMMV